MDDDTVSRITRELEIQAQRVEHARASLNTHTAALQVMVRRAHPTISQRQIVRSTGLAPETVRRWIRGH